MSILRPIIQENVFFQAMNQVFKVINDNVDDINAVRRARPLSKDRQWVFPTVPEANDEDYPRVALIPLDIHFEEWGAGRFIRRITDSSDNVKKDIFGRVAIIPLTIGVFCKKRQVHKVETFDGTLHKLQNSKQSDYLGFIIANRIEKFRKSFIDLNMDIKTTAISTSYEDNDFLWAKNISAELIVYDVWIDDYSIGQLIADINLAITTNLV